VAAGQTDVHLMAFFQDNRCKLAPER